MPGMPLTVGDRTVRPLTADEVLRMVATGILSEDEPVELLHGVLTAVSPHSEPHVAVLQRLHRWLAPLIVDGRHDVRLQMPLVVPDRSSLPEPGLAVVTRDDSTIAHPTSALLVIEVAVSSLAADTSIKPPLYAAAGVPEYWVVDVPGRRLRIFSQPGPSRYGVEGTVAPPGPARARGIDVEPLDLDALFAGRL